MLVWKKVSGVREARSGEQGARMSSRAVEREVEKTSRSSAGARRIRFRSVIQKRRQVAESE
jgi:hypothetical protein